MAKTKRQSDQERKLQQNIKQSKKLRAEVKSKQKTAAKGSVKGKPSKKKDGFFAKIFGPAPQSVQQSIPYLNMYRDGICRVSERQYNKTIQFFDINYQLAQADDQALIFENYCDFLNYFDSSISVQLTLVNQRTNIRDFKRSIQIPLVGDEHDDTRKEYNGVLQGQLKKGNNGITKRKYITFGIEADDLRTAKLRLERIETDILMNFKKFGVHAQSLDGKERLDLLHRQLHPDGQEKLRFEWSDLAKTGLSTKDFIAPSGFSLSQDGKSFRVGRHYGAASFIQILAPELSDQLLADFLQLNETISVNIHIKSIDQAEAIKRIKRKMSDLQKMKIEEQKRLSAPATIWILFRPTSKPTAATPRNC